MGLNMRVPNGVQDILRQKILHQDKIVLLKQLLDKEPDCTLINDFIRAEERLVSKKGMEASDIYERIAGKCGEPSWLVERQAKTLARYAYYNIGAGPIDKSFEIYTQKLGLEPDKAWKKIAEILKKAKGYGYAAQCYANAGMPGTAARMSEKLKDPQRSAWYYELAQEWVRSARMYKRAKLYDKAGECYQKANFMKLAVQQWKKAGTLEQHNIGEQMLQNIMNK
jgi:tetratricopeptide (TPR) repeat protein